MRTIIIDDESAARDNLKYLLQNYFPAIEIVAEGVNVESGSQCIIESKPDLVFLDVEMPDGTGFELLEQLKEIFFKVIFTTAHDKYAINAFKFSAVDYLLKPIVLEDLNRSVQRVMEISAYEYNEVTIHTLLDNMKSYSDGVKKIILKDAESIHVVLLQEIMRLEASDNYTIFHLLENRKIVISRTLKEYDKLLSNSGFFRVHQSHLININQLKRIDRKNGVIIMSDNSPVPLSKGKKDDLMQILENL
jgi:two-component system, LytTR family, response regulator